MSAFFTELFRIAPDKVQSLLDPNLDRDESSLWLRSLGDLELVELWEIITNDDSDGTILDDPLTDVTDELVVFSVPDEFTSAIRSIAYNDISDIAIRWSQCEAMEDWETAELEKVVISLQSLITSADENDEIIVQLVEM